MPSYVYFISDGHGHIKIGKADNTTERLKELQVGNPFRLHQILNIMVNSPEVAFDMERTLHRYFKNYQMEGEWFRERPVMEVICQERVKIGKHHFMGLNRKEKIFEDES